jgi:hypothetical protein
MDLKYPITPSVKNVFNNKNNALAKIISLSELFKVWYRKGLNLIIRIEAINICIVVIIILI